MRIFWWFFDRILQRTRCYWSSGVPPIMKNQNDREFAAIVAAIADLRKVDRSTAITVTPLFRPMLDRLSLNELRDYLLARYRNDRGEDQFTKYDLFEIGDRELMGFDGAFLYKDRLHIVFSYNDAWETVEKILAILLYDQL
jgi:hypothetical protein